MSIIKLQCTDQVLSITDSPLIASGGLQEDELQISFCSLWNGYTKTAIFYVNKDSVYYSVIDQNNECVIPHEVTDYAGAFYFGVFGVKDGVRRTSEVRKYKVTQGALSENTIPSDVPTPTVYEQMMAIYADILGMFDNAKYGGWVESIKDQNSGAAVMVWVGTEAEYAAITTKTPNCIYITTDDPTLSQLRASIAAKANPTKFMVLANIGSSGSTLDFTLGSLLVVSNHVPVTAGTTYKGLYCDDDHVVFTIDTDSSHTVPVLGTWRVIGTTGQWTQVSGTNLPYLLMQRVG